MDSKAVLEIKGYGRNQMYCIEGNSSQTALQKETSNGMGWAQTKLE
jgi:hypothetical protein